jgi:hypothetical protein
MVIMNYFMLQTVNFTSYRSLSILEVLSFFFFFKCCLSISYLDLNCVCWKGQRMELGSSPFQNFSIFFI